MAEWEFLSKLQSEWHEAGNGRPRRKCLGPSFDVQALGQALRVPAGYCVRVSRERVSPVMVNR